MMTKLRVGVLFGGRSAEHEVSVSSARGVLAAIDRDKFDVVPIGVTPDGRWRRLPDGIHETLGGPLDASDGTAVTLLPAPTGSGLTGLDDPSSTDRLDVILPLIHGTNGEDGTVQGLFELADVAYVGAGVLGSAAAMDKGAMKALLAQAGLPVADYRVIPRARWRTEPEAVRADAVAALGYPLFIKPANAGSSVGISKVRSDAEFDAGMALAARYDRKLLVEAAVENAHEVEIAVLGNDDPRASVPGEIVPANEFYDYDAKYHNDASELIIPAPLPADVVANLQRLALDAFRALDGAGLARIDFLVTRDTHQPYVLEANTLPGFTPISMYPKLWQASGLSYPKLIEALIELALERHRERRENLTRFLERPAG